MATRSRGEDGMGDRLDRKKENCKGMLGLNSKEDWKDIYLMLDARL